MSIKQAAFRDNEGRALGVGAFHDVTNLPEDFKVMDEGFIEDDGTFLTRTEASLKYNVDHLLESEDLNLSKSLKEYRFLEPKDNDSELAFNVIHNGNIVGTLNIAKNPSKLEYARIGYHMIHSADVHPLHRGNGIYGRLLQHASKYVKDKLGSKGLVSPSEYRSDMATGAWDRLASKGVSFIRTKGLEGEDFFMHEKEDSETSQENLDHEFDVEFKRWIESRKKGEDYKSVLGYDFAKAETGLFSLLNQGNLSNTTSVDHHEVARQMAGNNVDNLPEFEAARFLAGGAGASAEAIRLALILYDNDFELAALRAYGLPRNEKYREILRSTKKMLEQTLNKSDLQVTQIPRDIQPALPEAKDTAKAVQNAQAVGAIESVQLDPKAKHSKGTAIASDPNSGKKWLLKPGSGALSPSAGVNEELADQSSREVAFSKIAEVMGLEEYVPEAHLLLVDGKKVAALRLLGMNWKGLEKIRQSDGIDVSKLFKPYLQDGILYKWAFMDMVLGNVDRHANNIMIDKDELDNSSLETPQALKLIDHGSAFAGAGFDPAHDPKSFTPFYLRAWTKQNWSKMDAQSRFEAFPKLSDSETIKFGKWVDAIDDMEIKKILSEYGISQTATMNRFMEIKNVPEEARLNYLMQLWAGILS